MRSGLEPVIIGVGQQIWRERDVNRSPVDALAEVVASAIADTGSDEVAAAIDTMVQVPFMLKAVPDLAAAMPQNVGGEVAGRLGLSCQQFTSDVGGSLPQHLLAEFADRLQKGDSTVVVLQGVELLATFLSALRSGELLDWQFGSAEDVVDLGSMPEMTTPVEHAHGLFEPINAYPLFESALRHRKGLSAARQSQILGGLVAAMSEVASENPYAWKQQAFSAEQVLSTDNGNRMISHPYTKLMNAILDVDQAAAVVLTTAEQAQALGVDPAKWVYLRGSASANDTLSILERASLDSSETLRVVASAALGQSGLALKDIDHFDIYSCFPSAVQIACDAIGIEYDDPRGLTVTGGLTLFGGPGNNYSLHAIASMTECLRTTRGAGLVTANGGYLTKHSIGVYACEPGPQPWVKGDDASLQTTLDAIPKPEVADKGEGAFLVEAHTVRYKGGAPASAIALGRLDDDRRCVAISEDSAVIAAFLERDCVGETRTVSHVDGINTLAL